MSSRVATGCFWVVVVAAVLGGIEPRYRLLWAAENVLVVLSLPLLVVLHRRRPFSDLASVALCAFFLLHLAGAHFGYNEFPLFAEYRAWGWSRNHYDRVVHFAYGLLCVVPIHEVLARSSRAPRLLARYLAVSEIMGTSMIYELIEWAYAVTSRSEAGPMFLGAQGDPWDAHKDMALAALGAVTAMSIGALRDAGTQPDSDGGAARADAVQQ